MSKRSYFEGDVEVHEMSAKSALNTCASDIKEFARSAYDIQPVHGKYPSSTLGKLCITIVRARIDGYEWSHGKTKEEAIAAARAAGGLPEIAPPASLQIDTGTPETAKAPVPNVSEDLAVRLSIGNTPFKIEANNERAFRVVLSTLVEAFRSDEDVTMDSRLSSMIED